MLLHLEVFVDTVSANPIIQLAAQCRQVRLRESAQCLPLFRGQLQPGYDKSAARILEESPTESRVGEKATQDLFHRWLAHERRRCAEYAITFPLYAGCTVSL